jgi:hypothetical protein
MSLLVEISIVVASLAMVAITVATVRAMTRVEKATQHFIRLTGEIQQWIVQAAEFTREAQDAAASVRGVMTPMRRVADRFEVLGERAASLTAAVLEEVEPPIHAAVAVARGMRSFTAAFLERKSNRFVSGRPATNGGFDHGESAGQ